MKRIISIILVLALVTTAAFASDFHFVFNSAELNPTLPEKFLKGICPTVFTGGVGYTALELVPGSTTELQLIAGGGIAFRAFFEENYSSKEADYTEADYNVTQLMGKVKFLQGFNNDKFTAYASAEIRKETYKFLTGTNSFVKLSDAEKDSDGLVSYIFNAGVKLNNTKDTWFTRDGLDASVDVTYSPSKKGHSYYAAQAQAVYSKTIWQKLNSNGRNLVSFVFVDRLNAGYMNAFNDNTVPFFAQEFHSLGRKVRGFEKFTYSRAFTAVNNLEIRIASPEIVKDAIFARAILFADAGIAAGEWLQHNGYDNKITNIIASAGAVAELSIFDFINLGAQFSYLINGYNPDADRTFKDKTNIKMHLIFQLDY